MNIDFNEFFRMRIDIMKINDDSFRFKVENVYLDDQAHRGMHNSSKEYYLNAAQLKDLRDYVNEATNGLI